MPIMIRSVAKWLKNYLDNNEDACAEYADSPIFHEQSPRVQQGGEATYFIIYDHNAGKLYSSFVIRSCHMVA